MSARHERVLAALELREPDRVPTMDVMEEYDNIYEILGKKPTPLGFLFTHPWSAKAIDLLAPAINRSGLLDVEMDRFTYDRTAAAVKMGYDSAWVYHFPVFRVRDSRTFFDIFGISYDTVIDKNGNIGTPMYREGLIKSPADWEAWDKRDIFRVPARTHRVYSRVRKDFGDRIFIFGADPVGIFEVTMLALGFERFAVALRREKEFMRRFIKFYEDFACEMVEVCADAGLPGYVFGDDMAYRSGPIVNPRVLEEFYGDAVRRIVATAHAHGMKAVVHSDGNVYPLLEWYADCGFDGIQSLEPTAGMELARVKEVIGHRMCLIGNLDITHILVDAGKEEVYEAVRRSILDAGRGGGYIVAPTNSHPDMTVRNLRWMLEAVEKYGRYPLAA